MKVLVLGTGAQGSTVARNLDKEPKVSKIICADMDEQQVTSLASSLRSAEGVCVDAENYSEIRKLMESCDLVVNALPLEFGKNVLDAALDAGCNYQDFAACEGIGDSWEEGMEIMLTEYDRKFREAGLLAVIGTGTAPGIMCIAAREAVKHVDEAETIYINIYDGVRTEKFVPFWWSPHVALNDMVDKPVAFINGKLVNTEPFTMPITREYDYLGKPVTLVEHAHDEPFYIGRNSRTLFRNVRNVYFKYGGTGIEFGRRLYEEGKLCREMLSGGDGELSLNDRLIAELPKAPRNPEEVKAIVDGGIISEKSAMVCEVEGVKDGRPVRVEYHVHAPGLAWCYEHSGMSHEQYMTGNCGFLFTRLFVRGMMSRKGLMSSDMLTDAENRQYLKWAKEMNITTEVRITTLQQR